METKPLLFGIAGLLLGGLIVSIAASTLNKPVETMKENDIKSSFENKTGDDFDRLFLDHMILHHQDAVDIAKLAEKQAVHEEIKMLSKQMIEAQQKEIEQMKVWQADWNLGTSGHQHTH
jgi:uncharacterized protein (DUF305 family)